MLYIFDWDGTISNSAAKIVSCMNAAIVQAGLPAVEDDAIKNIIGLGLPEAVARLLPGISDEQLQTVRDGYSAFFIDADVKPSPFFDGVMDTLQTLAAQGHILTVATGKSRRGLDRVLGKLELTDFFHGSRCADETASKPDPKMLLELLAEFDVGAADAVMIGDTEYDMAMAQAIDMPRIAVSFGAHHIDRLRPYNPELCVDHFGDILRWRKS
ncbi:HAD family hydrolase [Teredinibacter turnerae]|uniref:HAD family hydrolase n=1 Tax=Teredinibacter turnerae TaxID=2426 RepID=UPI0005F86386|nr:HAD-IA family hydrolase [Teredinibacter turnerae]